MQLEAAVPPRLPDGSLPLPVLLQSPATDVTPPSPTELPATPQPRLRRRHPGHAPGPYLSTRETPQKIRKILLRSHQKSPQRLVTAGSWVKASSAGTQLGCPRCERGEEPAGARRCQLGSVWFWCLLSGHPDASASICSPATGRF